MSEPIDLSVVARGLRFPEGPIAMADGSVIVVEVARQTLSRVGKDERIDVIAHLGGGPNGAAIGPDGAAYVCNNGGLEWHETGGMLIPGHRAKDYAGGSIQRVDLKTGETRTLYTHGDGAALIGPNDLVFDADGGFYFSDHGASNGVTLEYGALYYAKADGSHIAKLRGGLLGPNGVGISPDGKRLYMAETPTSRLWAYDIIAPGEIGPAPNAWQTGDLICTLPHYHLLDSLKLEAGGNICVGTMVTGGITTFDPKGGHELTPFGGIGVMNLCFSGADMRDVTAASSASGILYRLRWPRPGLKLAFNA